MYDTSDIRKGLKILHNGDPYIVVDFQFVKPGKGTAFTKTKIKNMITGAVLDMTYRSGEKLQPANCEELSMQYLYNDGNLYHFMDNETFDQMTLDKTILGEALGYLKEGSNLEIVICEGNAIGIDLPVSVELQVVETGPSFKGNTASAGSKPAKIETGITIQVPFFINTGDNIKIDTRTGEYLERVG